MDKLTILGLDLSLSCPGYAVVQIKNGKPKLLESGIIKANPKHTQIQKMKRIVAHLQRLMTDYDIDAVARESGFVRHNRTTKILERVAGAVMVSLGEIHELPPTTIKKAVAESGKASKQEVELAVRLLLELPEDFEFRTDDESDAVAVALAYAIEQGVI
jgi:crossover junction endodeoxyribonuclease RuvC